jgi:hypothetical protein
MPMDYFCPKCFAPCRCFLCDVTEDKLQFTCDPQKPFVCEECFPQVTPPLVPQAGVTEILNSVQSVLNKLVPDAESRDYFVSVGESTAILAYQLSRCQNWKDYAAAIFACIKGIFPGSMILNVMNSNAFNYFKQLFSGLVPQSGEDCFAKCHNLLSDFKNLRECAFAKKLYKFVMYIVSLSFFDKCKIPFNTNSFNLLSREAMRKKFYLGPDFVYCVLDFLFFLAERGYQCMMTGSMAPILHGPKSYEKWAEEVRTLKLQSEFLSNCESQGFSLSDYLMRLDSAITDGHYIAQRCADMDDLSKRMARDMFMSLQLIKGKHLSSAFVQANRAAPFMCSTYGGSKVAKTLFNDTIIYFFCEIFDLPKEDEFIHTHNPFDSFWSGYSTAVHTLKMDDTANQHPDKVMGVDESISQLLQIGGNCSFSPPMADLESKGKVCVRVDHVVSTTNVQHLNTFAYFCNSYAVLRRFHVHLKIELKPAYMKEGVMDPDSMKTEGNKIPDFWLITVFKVIPQGSAAHQTARFVETHKFDDMNEFLVFYISLAKEHRRLQEQVMLSGKELKTLTICKTCLYQLCRCEEPLTAQANMDDDDWSRLLSDDEIPRIQEQPLVLTRRQKWYAWVVYHMSTLIVRIMCAIVWRSYFLGYLFAIPIVGNWLNNVMYEQVLMTLAPGPLYGAYFRVLGGKSERRFGACVFLKNVALYLSTAMALSMITSFCMSFF